MAAKIRGRIRPGVQYHETPMSDPAPRSTSGNDTRPPSLKRAGLPGRSARIVLSGSWTIRGLQNPKRLVSLEKEIHLLHTKDPASSWDLSAATLDHFGALLLRRGWLSSPPIHLELTPPQASLFARWERIPACSPQKTKDGLEPWLRPARWISQILLDTFALIGLIAFLFMTFLRQLGTSLAKPHRIPFQEISRNLYQMGFKALGIIAIVGSLIGIVISYLAALQLQGFALRGFLVFIIGISIVRELGPTLAAVLVAGRSGSAITAELGVMRIRGEIDAYRAMGIDPLYRLVFPRLVALLILLPLLVGWSDFFGIMTGLGAAALTLHTSFLSLVRQMPRLVPLFNLWFGIVKGGFFGLLIGLVACRLGWDVPPDAASLGQETTRSVVLSITLVIALDALAAVLFRRTGF